MWTCPVCDGQTEDGYDVCWTCRTSRSGKQQYTFQSAGFVISTTPSLETHDIVRYIGPVFGEAAMGANFFRDFAAAVTDVFGGRSTAYEEVLQRGRNAAIDLMVHKAVQAGGNALVDLDVKYEATNGTMFLVCASATAVYVVEKSKVGQPTN